MTRPSPEALTPGGSLVPLELEAQREYLDRFGWFTFTVPRGDSRWTANTIALLIEDDTVTEIGSLSRSQGGATGMRQLRYERGFELTRPLSVDELQAALKKPQLQSAFGDRVDFGGRLSPRTWAATIDVLRALRPEDAAALDALLTNVGGRTTDLSGNALQVGAQERDAFGLALDFADFDRAILREAVPDGEGSFVQRLGEVRALEDPTIAFDAMRFLDFEAIDSPSGVVHLRQDDEELFVVNANRNKLETTLGADLIYIHEQRRSAVFVQYKTMHGQLNGHPAFRGDANLDRELNAMRGITAGEDDGSANSFRLGSEYAFVKLCAPVTDLRRRESGPISGLYLPLGYLDAVRRGTDEGRGPQGGTAINQWTVRRYLDNTRFAELVRSGWIGTRGVASDELQTRIIAILQGDRSATVALKRTAADVPRGPRRRRSR